MAEHRHAFRGLGVIDGVLPHLAPVVVAALRQRRLALRALQDEAGVRLVRGEPDRLVEQRLIGNDAGAFDAAACRQDHLRLAVVDAGGEFLGRETAEHHRMDGADARAGQHREHRLRHHRHIENDDVALLDAEVAQHGAEQLHFRQQPAVGEALLGVGDRRIVDQRRLRLRPRARGGRARCSRCCRRRRKTSGHRCRRRDRSFSPVFRPSRSPAAASPQKPSGSRCQCA